MNETNHTTVSVPYRGATFLNYHIATLRLIASVCPGFRPLSGSYISQWYITLQGTRCSFRFPSPIGELHFSIEPYGDTWNHPVVSVPYRGATFLNTISANPPPVWCKYGNCVAKIIFAKCSCFWKYKSLQESGFKPCVAKS